MISDDTIWCPWASCEPLDEPNLLWYFWIDNGTTLNIVNWSTGDRSRYIAESAWNEYKYLNDIERVFY